MCQTGCALKATILADTNRDGTVDNSDLNDKATWSQDRGALFLANIGDTDQRCSKTLVPPNEDSEESECGLPNPELELERERYLDLCNDASDNIQRNPKYLAPLRTLAVKNCLSPDATASIHISDGVAAARARIFIKSGQDGWAYVGGNRTFTAAEFKDGLELGIDARDVRRPGPDGWDGLATVHFTIRSGEKTASDSVALRVAPVLTHHHNQLAQKVFATAPFGNDSQSRFVRDLKQNTADAGFEEPVHLFPDDIWTQDFFEPGYTSIPGPDGPVVLRIMIRSSQVWRWSGREVFTSLRSDSVGAVQHRASGGTTDSTGNLEAVPPHSHNGVNYPAGRVIMGAQNAKAPYMMEFLGVQETQSPILLDTDWLSVGHVDEFLQFLPYPNERGWVLMVDDPVGGLEIIERAAAAGHGSVNAVSRPHIPGEQGVWQCHLPLNETVDQVLDLNLTAVNQRAAERIQFNLDILKREVGITDDEIFYVPGIFTNTVTGGWEQACEDSDDDEDWDEDDDRIVMRRHRSAHSSGPAGQANSILRAGTPPKVHKLNSNHRRQTNETGDNECDGAFEEFCKKYPEYCGQDTGDSWLHQVVALYPAVINSVVMSDSLILAANPWGPIIDGVDILAQAATEAYAKVGYNVTFQDNWFSHHMGNGELHCGSNTWRETDTEWW